MLSSVSALVLFIDYLQTLQQQVVVNNDPAAAVRNDLGRKTARSYYRGFAADLFMIDDDRMVTLLRY